MELKGGLFWSLGLASVKAPLEGKAGVALRARACARVCVCVFFQLGCLGGGGNGRKANRSVVWNLGNCAPSVSQ